jgi:hypothetical protein
MVEEMALEQVSSQSFIGSALIIIIPIIYQCPVRSAVALIRQHIITSSVFKLGFHIRHGVWFVMK